MSINFTKLGNRATISLAAIMKDERANLPRFLASVTGCFDEIHITDTGSTDGSVEYLATDEAKELAGCPLFVHYFPWVHDFAKAREASFSYVKTDYAYWQDLDDVLSDKQAFIHFRDTVMSTADYWLATYHYAWDPTFTTPICSFTRERVIKMGKGFKWRYFVHEGCVPVDVKGPIRSQQVSSWTVNHMRSDEDLKKDKARNLNLFEEHERTEGLCPRMLYYYGKELFESKRFMEAGVKLLEASKKPDIELHDRIMAIQYAMGSAMECKQFEVVQQLGVQGIRLLPSRAEFWVLLGDSYVQTGKLAEAKIFYESARACQPNNVHGFVIVAHDAYQRYPTEQLAVIALNLGDLDGAQREIDRLRPMNPARAAQLDQDLARVSQMTAVNQNSKPSDDIIITCPPMSGPNQDWDEVMHEKRGLGGSETAAVELAEFWQKQTGRQVIIFNNRKSLHVSPSGVQYRPVTEIAHYLQNNKPYIHIAWRHSSRLTDAPSYLWCHDLFTPGAEHLSSYDKILCLSPFHRDYVKALQNIPEEKVMLMRNGIEAKHFKQVATKNENKIIFPSSPDRGLDRCIEIISRARKSTGKDLELHVFYGFENMRAMGMAPQADRLEKMMQDNPWVKYHGNVKKDVLAKHFIESAIWLYPADFIETFCITALEAMAGGCYALVRNFGGVVDTIRPFAVKGMAEIVNSDASTPEELDLWAAKLSEAILEKRWENVKVNASDLSWQSVANEWIEKLDLNLKKKLQAV